jgi:hypothetical protein
MGKSVLYQGLQIRWSVCTIALLSRQLTVQIVFEIFLRPNSLYLICFSREKCLKC